MKWHNYLHILFHVMTYDIQNQIIHKMNNIPGNQRTLGENVRWLMPKLWTSIIDNINNSNRGNNKKKVEMTDPIKVRNIKEVTKAVAKQQGTNYTNHIYSFCELWKSFTSIKKSSCIHYSKQRQNSLHEGIFRSLSSIHQYGEKSSLKIHGDIGLLSNIFWFVFIKKIERAMKYLHSTNISRYNRLVYQCFLGLLFVF